MVTKVLCVAEKNSIAKAVAQHLSGGRPDTQNIPGAQFNKNYVFSYNFPTWGPCDVVMTSVSGHLMERDFDAQYKNWQASNPSVLFEARINKNVAENSGGIARNIENKARWASVLYIWTDCDREGEHIGTEIREIALRGNNRLRGQTVRARFSNIERAHVINAARNPVALDEAQANAVESRIELDLRIGACFTRKLTLTLKPMLPPSEDTAKKPISYGSCQFPTLGFVVERYFRVRNFVPETFWGIKVMHEKGGIKVNFRWARGHLFDRMMAVVLFERCLTARTARVTKVQTKPTSKWKPLPLTTVELQKCGSRFLRMDSQRVMTVAEKLYQSGHISYPRTETDQFDGGMDLRALVQKQTPSQSWGQHAQGLMNGGFSQPRPGRNNDKAHPPIHPVNFVAPNVLNQDEQKVYEFVARRFIACCSEDAKGSKTEISILYGDETFNTSGLTVLERNYLDVYPYDKWTSTQELPRFDEGETLTPTEARIHEGQTSPPGYLTEPELIALMDANGIGTDATMAEHIAKIKEREYVQTRPRGRRPRNEDEEVSEEEDEIPGQAAGGRGRGRGRGRGGRGRGGRGGANSGGGGATSGVQEFIPTTLGVALIEGYESMGFEISLAKPFLRKEMEMRMKAICEGRKTGPEVVAETIEQYRIVYGRTEQHIELLRRAVRKYVLGQQV
ncbi:DNA topoisomerase [Lecanosticta acicola]|uniref:DNA topoisomerase n=1 Tax=Lecanosticta acicola TaxID=111012 RepID=A0AAI8Z4Z1_9PEZI|nr:DNA topoisomerase [Lecanosticta acicola]